MFRSRKRGLGFSEILVIAVLFFELALPNLSYAKSSLCLALPSLPEKEAQQKAFLEAMKELKPQAIRVEINELLQEPQKSLFHKLLDLKIEFIGVIIGHPRYTVPSDLQAFKTQVYQMVQSFQGKIKLFEVWNEQNAGYRFFKPREDPGKYGALLKAAYQAVKEADPEAKVLYGGLFYHPQGITGAVDFLRQSVELHPDLGHFFDGLALHPYPLYPPTRPPEYNKGSEVSLVHMIRNVESVLRSFHFKKPIFITEVGWPVYGAVTEKEQADYLIRSLVLSLSAGARSVCWYTFSDRPHNPYDFPPEGAFGMTHPFDGKKFQPKEAFFAFKTLSEWLGGAVFLKSLQKPWQLEKDQHAYLFGTQQHEIIVFWTARRNKTARVRVKLPSYQWVDGLGRKRAHGKKGRTTLIFENRPKYLLCDRSCF